MISQSRTTGTSGEYRQVGGDLPIFHEIARALTSSLDLQSTLTAILTQIEKVCLPEAWGVFLYEEQGEELCCAVAGGRFGSRLSGVRVPRGEGMAGRAAERGEVLIVSDERGDSFAGPDNGPHVGFEFGSAVSLPLRSGSRILGVAQFFNLPAESLCDGPISFLQALCDFAAVAVERANVFRRVQELTVVDECTGLFNVRHFDQSLRNEITRSGRLNLPMGLIFLDLDHFKLVNDRYGHQVGSEVLAQVGKTIRSQVRSIDLAFRYGGDEFVILLPGTGKRLAVQVANRLVAGFRAAEHAVSESLLVGVTASFGVATYPDDGRTGAEILHAADARMYEVKGTTRDAVVSFGRGRRLERPA